MTVQDIAREILAKPSNKLTLIAVEGFGGSGKTTLANQLSKAFGNAYVVNIDDFIVKEKLTEPSWDKGAFDRGRLEREVLIPATTGQPIQYEELIWKTNTLGEPKVVPAVNYVIVEGISSYHPDIAHYYNYKIWVDTPIAVAKERGRARDGSNENVQFWDLWAQNDLTYQRAYHSKQRADFVLKN